MIQISLCVFAIPPIKAVAVFSKSQCSLPLLDRNDTFQLLLLSEKWGSIPMFLRLPNVQMKHCKQESRPSTGLSIIKDNRRLYHVKHVKILKAEIARISKREAKSATEAIGKSNTWLRKTVADMKKRLVLLEKENRSLVGAIKKFQLAQPDRMEQEEGKKVRFSSRGIRTLRKKLRLSQADFGKLLGTTPHAVYLWEKKAGALNLRDKTKAAILSVRAFGNRETNEQLKEIGKKLKKGRKSAF